MPSRNSIRAQSTTIRTWNSPVFCSSMMSVTSTLAVTLAIRSPPAEIAFLQSLSAGMGPVNRNRLRRPFAGADISPRSFRRRGSPARLLARCGREEDEHVGGHDGEGQKVEGGD